MIHNELINRILSSIILISLSIFFIIKGDLFFICFILVLLFISIYEWYLMTKNTMYKLLGIIFLIISFYSSYLLRMEMDLDYIYFNIDISTKLRSHRFLRGGKTRKKLGWSFCYYSFQTLPCNLTVGSAQTVCP